MTTRPPQWTSDAETFVDEHKRKGNFLAQDLRHETIGAQWLAGFFPAEVTEPVRLHVPAKRWLCTMRRRLLALLIRRLQA